MDLTALVAASSRSSAAMMSTSLLLRISLPFSTLVPSNLTMRGTDTPTCAHRRPQHLLCQSQDSTEKSDPPQLKCRRAGCVAHPLCCVDDASSDDVALHDATCVTQEPQTVQDACGLSIHVALSFAAIGNCRLRKVLVLTKDVDHDGLDLGV